MAESLMELLEKVHDEKTFLQFLRALREDLERSQRECGGQYHEDCAERGHWESTSTKDFLRAAEEWGHGDFGDGEHYGEPMLRRVATMLYAGRYRVRE